MQGSPSQPGPSQPSPSPHALAFILITILLDTIGLGIVIPVTPQLLLELSGNSGPGGLSEAATWGGWLGGGYALMQFIFAPIIGNLSDRFGRRPVLLLSLLAFAIDYAIMGFATSMWMLFVGRCLAGAAGGSYIAANAYIADISTPDERAKRFGLVGAAFGVGFILGPVVGGLLGEFGSRVPFYAAAIVAAGNLLYGLLVVPESLLPENRRAFSLRRANPVGAVLQVRRYPLVFALLGSVLLYQLAHDANPSTFNYFVIAQFNWTPREVGASIGLIGLLIAIVQGGLIGVVLPRLGERRAAMFGLGCMAIGFTGYAFSTVPWMLFASMLPFALCGFAMPAMRSMMSRAVPADAQGELQGATASMSGITMIVAPLLMTQLFAWATTPGNELHFPGAPFLLAGALALLSLLWLTRTLAKHRA